MIADAFGTRDEAQRCSRARNPGLDDEKLSQREVCKAAANPLAKDCGSINSARARRHHWSRLSHDAEPRLLDGEFQVMIGLHLHTCRPFCARTLLGADCGGPGVAQCIVPGGSS